MAGISKVLTKILTNGKKIQSQVCGNQTMTRIFDEGGNLLRVRAKKVVRSTIPPQKRSQVGFITGSQPQGVKKDVISITKNDCCDISSHYSKTSNASILDRVYVKGQKVGERLRYSSANGNDPMEAMNKLKNGTYDKRLISECLKEDAMVSKVNKYSYTDKLRQSREINYVHNSAFEKQLCHLSDEANKLNREGWQLMHKYCRYTGSRVADKFKERIANMQVKHSELSRKFAKLRSKENNLLAQHPLKEGSKIEFLGANLRTTLKDSYDDFIFTI